MASSVIGALRVNLGIDTAAFTEGMKGANASLSRLGAQMTKVGAIAGAALGGAAVLFGKAMLDISKGADEMGKLAQKTGVPIEELSGLAYAAKMADVEIGGLATGLRKLSVNMVEAASNSKSQAAAAFNAIGVSVTGVDGKLKTSSQVLTEVAGKFAGYNDGASKAALAVQLFGKAGGDLIPLLNGGSGAIATATERARAFGLVISAETATAADTFNDSIEDMGNLLQGFLTTVFARLAGPLSRVSAGLVDAAAKTDLLKAASERLVSAITSVIAFVGREIAYIRGLARELNAVKEIVNNLDFSSPGKLVKSISLAPLTEAVKQTEAEIEGVNAAVDDLIAKPSRIDQAFEDGLGTVQMDLNEFRNTLVEVGEAPILPDPAKTAKDAARIKKSLDEVARARQELGEEFTQLFNETRTDAEAAALEIQRLDGLLGKGLDPDVYARAVKNVNEELRGTNQLAEDLSSTLEGGLNSAFRSALDGAFNLKDFLLNMIKDVAAAAFANSIAGVFGGGAGGGTGIGGFLSGILGVGGNPLANSMAPMRAVAPGISPKAANSNRAGGVVQVNVVAGEFFDARVAQTSGAVAATMIKTSNKAAPGMMADRQMRGVR